MREEGEGKKGGGGKRPALSFLAIGAFIHISTNIEFNPAGTDPPWPAQIEQRVERGWKKVGGKERGEEEGEGRGKKGNRCQ